MVSKLPELELEEELAEEPEQEVEHMLELGEELGEVEEEQVQGVECIVEMELVVGGMERGNLEQELVEVG